MLVEYCEYVLERRRSETGPTRIEVCVISMLRRNRLDALCSMSCCNVAEKRLDACCGMGRRKGAGKWIEKGFATQKAAMQKMASDSAL